MAGQFFLKYSNIKFHKIRSAVIELYAYRQNDFKGAAWRDLVRDTTFIILVYAVPKVD